MSTDNTKCWCGQQAGEFSDSYGRCSACGTLVSLKPSDRLDKVDSSEGGFYGKEYWFSHQQQAYGQPTIIDRSRTDLPERCIHWLKNLLRWRLPPGKTLELGCAHGGFVRMLKETGFDATGLEMSPWIADYAKKTFGVNVLQGPLREQSLAAGELDVLMHFDVLEHFSEPSAEISLHARLIKPEGMMLFQTPCYRDEGPTWSQCKESEHLFLFNETSVRMLLERAGFSHVVIEPGLFPYDMMVAACRRPLAQTWFGNWLKDGGEIPAELLGTSVFLSAIMELHRQWAVCERDRQARLDVINEQQKRIELQNDLLGKGLFGKFVRVGKWLISGRSGGKK